MRPNFGDFNVMLIPGHRRGCLTCTTTRTRLFFLMLLSMLSTGASEAKMLYLAVLEQSFSIWPCALHRR